MSSPKVLFDHLLGCAPGWGDVLELNRAALLDWLGSEREPSWSAPLKNKGRLSCTYGDLLQFLQDAVRKMAQDDLPAWEVCEVADHDGWCVEVWSEDGLEAFASERSRFRCWVEVFCELADLAKLKESGRM